MSKYILKVALTGGIASGKSQVSELLGKHGNYIIDLDIIARKVVELGTDGLNELVLVFGKVILNDDGTLNRSYLRDKLYQKNSDREQIEKIIQPKILHKMQTAITEHEEGIIIVVVPLLVEKNLWRNFDRAIIVDTTVKRQLERLQKRDNIDKNKAEEMLLCQASREKRLELSQKLPTDIVENNSEIVDLEEKVAALHEKLAKLL